uniref:Uncharacterized protein n=1 Tax=Rhizophora mucronata TaxID=61149 RepID=A0A2P2K8X2_RHIMU
MYVMAFIEKAYNDAWLTMINSPSQRSFNQAKGSCYCRHFGNYVMNVPSHEKFSLLFFLFLDFPPLVKGLNLQL